jgi:heme/copper-type cytochrome/quinol oxidase subunit 3
MGDNPMVDSVDNAPPYHWPFVDIVWIGLFATIFFVR